MRGLALKALTALVEKQTDANDADGAMATAHRLLAIDPLLESAHRALMSLYAARGNRRRKFVIAEQRFQILMVK